MRRGLEFILGLLHESCPAYAAREDFEGPHGGVLRLFQRLGFLATEPGMNRVPSCPHCLEGTPFAIEGTYFCSACAAEVDIADLQLWPLRLGPFLGWLASAWQLRGGIEPIGDELWRLGTLLEGETATECFYVRGRDLPEPAARRLAAFRSTLVVHGGTVPPRIDGRAILLADVVEASDEALRARPLEPRRRGGPVRFDEASGFLCAGEDILGRVPLGTREFHFLSALAAHRGRTVPYADLKHAVSRASGSADETEEATFCQKLKSRIKLTYKLAEIDRVLRPDPAAGGYVLLAEADLLPG